MKSRRLAILAVIAVASLGLAACGHKQDRVTHGETEGAYIDVGPLKYQVQISRQLNPADIEDRAYLNGVAAADRQLKADETWFAVFMRVDNESGKAERSANQFTIKDTQETVFQPIPIGGGNPLAYHSTVISNKSHSPDPDEIAQFAPTGGKLLLFKMPIASLDNRPLELMVHSPTPPIEVGTITLDV
jgi:hypothetical protein